MIGRPETTLLAQRHRVAGLRHRAVHRGLRRLGGLRFAIFAGLAVCLLLAVELAASRLLVVLRAGVGEAVRTDVAAGEIATGEVATLLAAGKVAALRAVARHLAACLLAIVHLAVQLAVLGRRVAAGRARAGAHRIVQVVALFQAGHEMTPARPEQARRAVRAGPCIVARS